MPRACMRRRTPRFDDLNNLADPGRAVYVPNGVELLPGPDGDSVTRATDSTCRQPRRSSCSSAASIQSSASTSVAAAFGRVLGQHPDAHLVIAGPDEEAHRATVAPLFTPFGASVTWTGRVDDTAKRQLLDAAAVLVLSSNSGKLRDERGAKRWQPANRSL